MGWGGVGRRGAGRGGAASCVFYEVRRLCDRSGEEPCQVSGACPGSLEAQLMTSDDTSLLVPNSHDSYENIMRNFSWKKANFILWYSTPLTERFHEVRPELSQDIGEQFLVSAI